MGFTPQQVDAMSMWQWMSAVNGYIAANSPKGGGGLSESEADELFEWIEAGNDNRPTLTTPIYAFDDDGRLMPAGVVTFQPS